MIITHHTPYSASLLVHLLLSSRSWLDGDLTSRRALQRLFGGRHREETLITEMSKKHECELKRVRLSREALERPQGTVHCEHCARTFGNANALHMHTVKTHKVLNGGADHRLLHRVSTPGVLFAHHCPVEDCRYHDDSHYFNQHKLLLQHYRKVHTAKTLRCSKCQMAFSLRPDLTYHEKKCLATTVPKARAMPRVLVPVRSLVVVRVSSDPSTSNAQTQTSDALSTDSRCCQTLPSIDSISFPPLQQMDFDCQVSPSGVEFGTQMDLGYDAYTQTCAPFLDDALTQTL